MSETTSSPSVNQHPISRSSSLSSTPPDSAPASEPTSDEQPDLGAFTTVLREWSHLQPPPRIPIQVRSATSSTTPTYHAEQSVTGSEGPGRSRSRTSRSRGTRSALSTLSSFTRPPTSSAQPDESTVWAHAPIASYLMSGTPSIERSEEREADDQYDTYTPSPPSRTSTALTVEIASEVDYPSFDERSVGSLQNRDDLSLEDTASATIPITVAGESESQELDSRQTPLERDEIDSLSPQDRIDDASLTSRDFIRPMFQGRAVSPSRHSDQSITSTSVHLQSQARPVTTTFISSPSASLPLSLASSEDPGVTVSIAGPSNASQINSVIAGTSSDSNSTLRNDYMRHGGGSNRSRNQLHSRRMSDSSYLTSVSASSLSLVSYRLPETPSALALHEEESDQDPDGPAINESEQRHQPSHPNTSSSALSGSGLGSLKTQPSLPSTSSSSLNSLDSVVPQGHVSHSSISSTGSPLPNPHSPLGTPEQEPRPLAGPVPFPTQGVRPALSISGLQHRSIGGDFGIVDDSGTPDQPPSETVLFAFPAPTRVFELVHEDEPASAVQTVRGSASLGALERSRSIQVGGVQQISTHSVPLGNKSRPVLQPYPSDESLDEDELERTSRYPHSHAHTPRYPFAHTPRGIQFSSDVARHVAKAQDNLMASNSLSTTSTALRPSIYSDQRHRIADGSTQAHRSYDQLYSASSSNNVSLPQGEDEDVDTRLGRHYDNPMDGLHVSHSSTTSRYLQQETSHFLEDLTPILSHLAAASSGSVSAPIADQSSSARSHSQASASLVTQPHLSSSSSDLHFHDHDDYLDTLAGLHLLPTEPPRGAVLVETPFPATPAYLHGTIGDNLPGPEESRARAEGLVTVSSEPDIPSDESKRVTGLNSDLVESTGVLPSLGYLDEALGFIAAERAKWTAARDTMGLPRGRSLERWVDDDENEEEVVINNEDGEGSRDGEDNWRNTIDQEKGGEQHKRKRRRKRTSKASGGTGPDSVDAPPASVAVNASAVASVETSPKKRRSKSAAPSASMSSLRSRASDKSGTMTPGRRRLKGKEKEFLVPPATFATRSPSGEVIYNVAIDSDFEDGGRTPTASLAPGLLSTPSSILSPLNLFGKKGKRVGRREREREKSKLDAFKAARPNEAGTVLDAQHGMEVQILSDDGNDIDGDDLEPRDEDEVDLAEENDSISNMSLLKPPRKRSRSRRRKPKDLGNAHTLTRITGVYRSTPASPKRGFLVQNNLGVDSDDAPLAAKTGISPDPGSPGILRADVVGREDRERKKRVRTKRSVKTLTRVRSYPNLKLEAEMDQSNKASVSVDTSGVQLCKPLQETSSDPLEQSDTSQKGRLLSLARHLRQTFPDQRQELHRVTMRLEKIDSSPTLLVGEGSGSGASSLVKPSPVVAGKKLKRSKKLGHAKAASDGGSIAEIPIAGPSAPTQILSIGEETSPLDPRGRAPNKTDPLIHVFIDHSNILIGLLSHLKRRSLTRLKSTPRKAASNNSSSDPALAFASVKSSIKRPLPVVPAGAPPTKPLDSQSSKFDNHLVPLPSFATLPRSLPARSTLTSYTTTVPESSSDDHVTQMPTNLTEAAVVDSDIEPKEVGQPIPNDRKKTPKHLWHTALTLILERGRPITRRVVVASSPLYQPMEPLESLGYELRVFVRVPDLGDGMDRERLKDKDKAASKAVNGTQSSHGVASKASKPGHARRFSESASAESGPGAGASNAVSVPGTSRTNSHTSARVKYREQGVDELLQLKLHQAIAATDDIPEGSTIVLATGDGNMGQFNEEGFIGSIRTALRRGWKVELYAWEDGLSRAWRREFGDGTEWSKRGMFCVVGMEEFASWLVEAPQV